LVTTGSKYFFGLALFALVAAAVYGGATAGHEVNMATLLGVVTLGYKGTVGDQLGYTVLMGLCLSALFLGLTTVAFRDGDPEAGAQVVGADTVPDAPVPQGASYWPVVAAFGVGALAIGVVVGAPLVILGVAVLLAVTLEWAVKAWSERATGDPMVNRAIRNRFMNPVEIPLLAVVIIGLFVLSISRVLIALPKYGAYVLFGGVPAVILLVGWLISTRPRLNPTIVTVLLLLGGVAVLAGGVIGATVGPREIEKHVEEGGEEGGIGVTEPGAPIVVRAGA